MKWHAEKFSTADKTIRIDGPLPLEVDYDDVDHKEVREQVRHLVWVLNTYWREKPWPKVAKDMLKKPSPFPPQHTTWCDDNRCEPCNCGAEDGT